MEHRRRANALPVVHVLMKIPTSRITGRCRRQTGDKPPYLRAPRYQRNLAQRLAVWSLDASGRWGAESAERPGVGPRRVNSPRSPHRASRRGGLSCPSPSGFRAFRIVRPLCRWGSVGPISKCGELSRFSSRKGAPRRSARCCNTGVAVRMTFNEVVRMVVLCGPSAFSDGPLEAGG